MLVQQGWKEKKEKKDGDARWERFSLIVSSRFCIVFMLRSLFLFSHLKKCVFATSFFLCILILSKLIFAYISFVEIYLC